MIYRRSTIPVLVVLVSMILSACGLAHDGGVIRIDRPSPGQVFNLGDALAIEVQGNGQAGAQAQIIVNGAVFQQMTVPAGTNPTVIIHFTRSTTASPAGVTVIGFRVLPAGLDRNMISNWRSATDVCIYVVDATHNAVPSGLNNCANVTHQQAQPIRVAPSATPTLAPRFTPTPASDRDCPPGTYFATNRCIRIQILNPPAGNGGPLPPGSQPGSQPSCPAGETYTCDPVCGCAPG